MKRNPLSFGEKFLSYLLQNSEVEIQNYSFRGTFDCQGRARSPRCPEHAKYNSIFQADTQITASEKPCCSNTTSFAPVGQAQHTPYQQTAAPMSTKKAATRCFILLGSCYADITNFQGDHNHLFTLLHYPNVFLLYFSCLY